jgi:hypothetical protein
MADMWSVPNPALGASFLTRNAVTKWLLSGRVTVKTAHRKFLFCEQSVARAALSQILRQTASAVARVLQA